MRRNLIVNADDFGISSGVNRAIAELHRLGVVTSTSFMVTGRAREEAAALASELPALGIGLHWDVWGEDERTFDLSDLAAVRDELARQLDEFEVVLGRPPTHLDSHRHAHARPSVFELFLEAGRELGVPVRGDGTVAHVSDFYAQWEWLVTDLDHVSVDALTGVLRDKVGPGWTELACHPGYVTADFTSIYLHEREAERATLADPTVLATVEELGIRLGSYADLAAGSSG